MAEERILVLGAVKGYVLVMSGWLSYPPKRLYSQSRQGGSESLYGAMKLNASVAYGY